jgi:hypothetical protein
MASPIPRHHDRRSRVSHAVRQFLLRQRLAWCERAVDHPYTAATSLKIDRALVAYEAIRLHPAVTTDEKVRGAA